MIDLATCLVRPWWFNAEFILDFLTRILALMCNDVFDEIELCE